MIELIRGMAELISAVTGLLTAAAAVVSLVRTASRRSPPALPCGHVEGEQTNGDHARAVRDCTGPPEIVMHHKRKRPKSTRAGCLLCKPHKRQGACLHQRAKPSDQVRLIAADEAVRTFRCEPGN